MPQYIYTGCVTAFSESGDNQLIIPSSDQTTVEREDNDYGKRLLMRELLIASETDINLQCVPTGISVDNTVISNPDITYCLTLSANGRDYQTVSTQGVGRWSVAKIFKESLRIYGNSISESIVAGDGGGSFWINAPTNQFWPDGVTVGFWGLFGGSAPDNLDTLDPMSETNHNKLQIVPTPGEQMKPGDIDLYQYIIDAPADGIDIHSCAVLTMMGI